MMHILFFLENTQKERVFLNLSLLGMVSSHHHLIGALRLWSSEIHGGSAHSILAPVAAWLDMKHAPMQFLWIMCLLTKFQRT